MVIQNQGKKTIDGLTKSRQKCINRFMARTTRSVYGPSPGVVITGGTRGIGRGLAREFLARGARVMISGRDALVVEETVKALHLESGSSNPVQRVFGKACDARRWEEMQSLWDSAEAMLGAVDIWINNAGVGQPQTDIEALDPRLIASIFETNCSGALFGCKIAMTGMKKRGRGAIYNLEGLGSSGGLVQGMTAYGASKRALAYIVDSLALDARGTGIIVGALRPGMTATDLITGEYHGKPEEWAKVSRIFNILSDTVETISPWLVDRMLRNRRNGARIEWLTGSKAAWRFMTAPFNKRKIYPDTL